MAPTITLVVLTLYMAIVSSSNVDYDGSVFIRMFHSLNPEYPSRFIERGNITITSLRQGSSSVMNNLLSEHELKQLSVLTNTDTFYRVKFLVVNFDGSTKEFLSSIKSCMLAESNLSDLLTISLDHNGYVITVTESVLGALLCDKLQFNDWNIDKFQTTVLVQHTEQGAIPDTATYIQKIEREREARERGDSKDNRSFLAKYWMYIVPVVIFMLISSAANPEAAAGGGR